MLLAADVDFGCVFRCCRMVLAVSLCFGFVGIGGVNFGRAFPPLQSNATAAVC